MRDIEDTRVVAQGYTGSLAFYKPVSLNVTIVLPETAAPPFEFPLGATIGQDGFTLSIVNARANASGFPRAFIRLNVIADGDLYRPTPFVH